MSQKNTLSIMKVLHRYITRDFKCRQADMSQKNTLSIMKVLHRYITRDFKCSKIMTGS